MPKHVRCECGKLDTLDESVARYKRSCQIPLFRLILPKSAAPEYVLNFSDVGAASVNEFRTFRSDVVYESSTLKYVYRKQRTIPNSFIEALDEDTMRYRRIDVVVLDEDALVPTPPPTPPPPPPRVPDPDLEPVSVEQFLQQS